MSETPFLKQAIPLIERLERYDFLSAAHTWRVTLYARAVAEAAGLNHEEVDRIGLAAALHDVGKLDVPLHILQKPGSLTPPEFGAIKRHPVAGERRLREMGVADPTILALVRHHHERQDGAGYPDGLRADDIPPPARYFAVIDTFDALTSVRPYRAEVGAAAAERALTELRAGVGPRYCAEAVELFESVYRSGTVRWVLHHFNDASDLPRFDFRSASVARPG
jgi:HD-GYP domain-containing protein (c-di-GMP phosphodiesterase class II)